MSRVSKAELDSLVNVLNRRLGRPMVTGRVGNLFLQSAYGNGPRLYEQLDIGVREASPRLQAGKMAEYLRAMLTGIELAEVNIKTAAPELNGLPGFVEQPDMPEAPGWDGAGAEVEAQRG